MNEKKKRGPKPLKFENKEDLDAPIARQIFRDKFEIEEDKPPVPERTILPTSRRSQLKNKKKELKYKYKPDSKLARKLTKNKKTTIGKNQPLRTDFIGPQPGPQTEFLSCPADIVIYGGAAGGGKSFSLLLDPLRYIHHKEFGAVILRRTYGEIKKEGALWDEANKLYGPLGAKARESDLSFKFPSGARISFHHLQHEKDIYGWQGSQVPYIGFDELTHFTPRQFWYLQSRQRNVTGIPNLMRGTTNPDPDSFVRYLIDWWIDPNGYPISQRSGKIRWFVRVDDDLKWADSREELLKRYPKHLPRSFTFIAAKLADNQILMQKDPGYLSSLLNMPTVDRGRLLEGNWNIRPVSGLYFKRSYFEIIKPENVPAMTRVCRGWDLAGSPEKKDKNDAEQPAATAGVKLGRDASNNIYVMNLQYDRVPPMQVERMVVNCATQDGQACTIRLPQDPGQAGKAQIAHFAKLLLGYHFKSRVMTGDKITRAGPFSSACENGKVFIVEGNWNETFLNHLEQFPPEIGSPDIVDATVEAFHELTSGGMGVKRVVPVSITV